jgi:hypothetical protein
MGNVQFYFNIIRILTYRFLMIPNSNSKRNYSRDFDRFAKNSLSWASHMYIFQFSIKCVTFHAYNKLQYNKMRTAIKNR